MKYVTDMKSMKLSSRTEVREGDHVRFTSTKGHWEASITGTWEVRGFISNRSRTKVWIEVVEFADGMYGQTRTVFVKGRPYRRDWMPEFLYRPYKVRKVKK